VQWLIPEMKFLKQNTLPSILCVSLYRRDYKRARQEINRH